MVGEACKAADLVLIPYHLRAFDLTAVGTTAGLVRAVGKPAFVVFMGGPQRAPSTYKEAQELIEGTTDVAGLGVRVAPVMLSQRAIYHHSTASGRTAQEAEPDGKGAAEVAGGHQRPLAQGALTAEVLLPVSPETAPINTHNHEGTSTRPHVGLSAL